MIRESACRKNSNRSCLSFLGSISLWTWAIRAELGLGLWSLKSLLKRWEGRSLWRLMNPKGLLSSSLQSFKVKRLKSNNNGVRESRKTYRLSQKLSPHFHPREVFQLSTTKTRTLKFWKNRKFYVCIPNTTKCKGLLWQIWIYFGFKKRRMKMISHQRYHCQFWTSR